ncbi:MAG: hypothetical protein QOE53_1718, partial [Pseudonocardiales bacterium]|nr:hypothetical protein [Pseudonocardiales bacterium]
MHSWPGAAARYQLDGTRDKPTLTVSVALDDGLPGPLSGGPPGSAPDAADRYRLIRSQLDEPGLTVALLTTLDPSLVLPSADGLPSLRRFAAAAQLFTQAAAAAMPPRVTRIATLGELKDRYGQLAEHLATAK